MRTMDIYDFAVGQARPEYARLKRALVVDRDVHHYAFYENVCRNIGHNVRVFDSIARAERWLAGNNSTVRA
jgi:hypothetical protein